MRSPETISAASASALGRIAPEIGDAQPGRCFLCNQVAERIVLREGPWEARQCRCGVVYTNPRPCEGFVPATEDGHPEAFYAYSARFKARWMSRRCPPGRLVEVGCGNGAFLAEARKLGYDVLGLEPDARRAEFVRSNLHIPVEQSLLSEQCLPRGQFDVVYHCDLLSHFFDPVAALESMKVLLCPGGVLCFEVGVLGNIQPFWYRTLGNVGLDRHIWLYSEGALKTLFQKAGLEVASRQRFGLSVQLITATLVRPVARLRRRFRRQTPVDARVTVVPEPRPQQRLTPFRALYERADHLLRYRVGALLPPVGPQTLLFVLRPK